MAAYNVGELAPPAHLFEQVQHLRLHRSIERRGRLVEQQDRRFEDERAGDGYALALAAGELVRVTEAEAVAEADLVQRTLDALFAALNPVDGERLLQQPVDGLTRM